MRLTLLMLFITMLALTYCTPTKAARKNAVKSYYYSTDVAPIIEDRCSPCHFPAKSGMKKPLDTYSAVSNTIDDILFRVQLPHDHPKFMPFKSKKEPLSDSLINVIKLWKESGMKEMPG